MSLPGHNAFCCLIVTVSALVPFSTHAGKAIPKWKRKRIALKQCYVKEEFRVFYAIEGESALSPEQRRDTDHDGVPDKIQNIARQLVVARRLYVEVFKLRHPFESPRYKGKVKYFDVHVSAMPRGSYGLAGDGIVNYNRPTDPPGGYEVLTLDLSKDMSCTNLTPTHELFHEFQNGYTLFKNAWYTEGTARWVEFALRKGVGTAGHLPTTRAEKEALFKRKYGASRFWNALALAADKKGVFHVPKKLGDARYVGTRQKIIQDLRLHGIDFMRTLLEELDAMDDKVSKADGLDPLEWKETRQRAPKNNEAIWTAILNTVRRFQEKSPALREFIRRF